MVDCYTSTFLRLTRDRASVEAGKPETTGFDGYIGRVVVCGFGGFQWGLMDYMAKTGEGGEGQEGKGVVGGGRRW